MPAMAQPSDTAPMTCSGGAYCSHVTTATNGLANKAPNSRLPNAARKRPRTKPSALRTRIAIARKARGNAPLWRRLKKASWLFLAVAHSAANERSTIAVPIISVSNVIRLWELRSGRVAGSAATRIRFPCPRLFAWRLSRPGSPAFSSIFISRQGKPAATMTDATKSGMPNATTSPRFSSDGGVSESTPIVASSYSCGYSSGI